MMIMPFLGKDFHNITLRKTGALKPETFLTDSLLQAYSQCHYLDACILLYLWCLWSPGWLCV